MFSKSRGVTVALVAMLTAFTASAEWSSFHGADRTNKSKETGLLKAWPEGGPKLLWTALGAGEGYSGVSVSGGMIYTAGSRNKTNFVFAYDMSGKRVWERSVGAEWDAGAAGKSWARSYQGSRGTPTVDDGMVYYISDGGVLVGLDAKTGAQKWSVDLHKTYGSEMPAYGYSESPLVVGGRVYAAAFGKKATVVCFDKKTGKVIWESGTVPGDGAFASPVTGDLAGFKQIVSFTSTHVFGINIENGAVLWTMPVKQKSNDLQCTDATIIDANHVFVSSGYGFGSALIKLTASGGKVAAQQVYKTDEMDNHHGGVIVHNGYVYGSGHKNSEDWFCLDVKTGKRMWKAKGKGSLTFAEGNLYLYDEKTGLVSLVKAAPDKFTLISSFNAPSGGKGAYWAHPVISGGVLYLRHSDKIFAYDIKAK